MKMIRPLPILIKQIEITNGKYRPATSDEKPWVDKCLSTPWNEIEVGMGLAEGMHVLELRQIRANDAKKENRNSNR